MLDQTDIDRVSAYIYEGFPGLKGRVAVRRFDPPSELRGLRGAHYDEALNRCKPKIREDFLDQFEEGRDRTEASYALDAAFNEKGGLLSSMIVHAFMAGCMTRFPSVRELTTEYDKATIHTGYYYITQFASGVDDDGMLKFWIGERSAYRAPREFARISGMFALAHEFTHIVHKDLFVESGHRVENLCDGVAAACVLSLEGREAKHALSYIRDGRLRVEAGSSHDTGWFLLHLLGDKSFPGRMGAKEALDHARNLYERLNPAPRQLSAAPAPVL